MEPIIFQAGKELPMIKIVRKMLLICGILSSLLYVAANVVGAIQWEGYRSASQTVSELSAIDAPSRPIVVLLFTIYSVLVFAFGLGVWGSAGRTRALRVVAGLLIGYGVVCIAGPFFPMHQREVLATTGGKTLTDIMQIVLTIVDVLFILLIIGFGAAAFGKRFSLYSIATIVILLLFGALTGMDAPRIQANLPTPWAGITERITIGVFLLWAVVLASVLLRGARRQHQLMAEIPKKVKAGERHKSMAH